MNITELAMLKKMAGGGNSGGASVELDKTLTKEGYAADAKAVGDRLAAIGNGGGGGAISGDNVEVYVVQSGMPPTTVDELLALSGATNGEVHYQVVETLPENLTMSDMENSICYLYIVKSTGIPYLDVGMGAPITLGFAFNQDDSVNKGWTNNVYAETEIGVYCSKVNENGLQIINYLTDTLIPASMEKIRKNFDNTVLRVTLMNGAMVFILKPAMIENGKYIYTTVELSLGGNYYSAKVEGNTGNVYLTHGTVSYTEK